MNPSNSIKPVLPVIISGCLLLLLSFGYRAGFGLFMQPMSEANGWGRDVLSLALAIQNLAWGVIAVFAGGLADRYGNLRVLLGGVGCYAVGMWAMAFATTEWQLISTAGLLVGAGIAGTSFGIVLPKQRLDVVTVAVDGLAGSDLGSPGRDLIGHLKRHGINAKHVQLTAKRKIDVGSVLLGYCADTRPDVLVAGAFGQNKIGSRLFGGISQYLLENMTLPVLMSH